jgi:ribonucleoside-diphosphate reductase alpha chain
MAQYAEAIQNSLEYFEGNKMAAKVFVDKYALRNPQGDILESSPNEMHRRLAREFARIEAKYPNPLTEDEIFGYLDKFKYIIPQGSPMAGIGNPFQKMSISNCFVIRSPFDSMSGIGLTAIEEREIMKRRGGVGFDISTIRPKGMTTSNAAGTTDGIEVFMEEYSDTCRRTAQNGRRGALMLTISVHHPEIRTFIHIKEDLKKVTGANISIRLSDEFMNAVKNKEQVQLRFPVDAKEPSISEMVDAQELWTEIIGAAHQSAEPGLLFWDTVMKYCPANCYPEYLTISTNPCGEITLSAYDSCRLLLVNALSFVKNPFTKTASMSWKDFGKVVQVAQRFMDDIVDLELECIDKILAKIEADPEPEVVKFIEKNLWTNIRKACVNGRRTGLGLTGVGDLVAAMGMRYGSEDSIRFVEHLYRVLALNSYRSSVDMAKERGAFPAFSHELEKDHPFLQRIWDADKELYQDYLQYGRRNIANLTTPPAGSTSMLAKSIMGFGVSSGIENVLYISAIRRKKINSNDKEARVDFVDDMGDKWTEFTVYHTGFEAWKTINGKTDAEIPESPYWNSTADDVDWVAKVDMQGVAQKWIDHSISNTTNLPEEATIDTVKDVYMRGWETGCKGITIYRKNSRAGVVLDAKDQKRKEEEVSFEQHHAPKRPSELECDVYHSTIQGEKWTIFVGKLNGKPYELMGGLAKYVNLPKRVRSGKTVKHNGEINPARYDFHYDFEKGADDETVIRDIGNVFENPVNSAFTRTISLNLRHGVPVQYVVEQLLKGTEKESDLFSFSKVMSRVLKNYIQDGTKTSQKCCNDCKSTNLSYQSGCITCLDCGSSKCG